MTAVLPYIIGKIRRKSVCRSIILLVLLAGCARLPDYAMPRGGILIEDPTVLQDAVTYRRLTRADFKASALPQDRAMHADTIDAHTCVQIRPAKDSQFSIHRARFGEAWAYFGRIQSIRFEAIMLPGCSWWNPATPSRRHAYVLQHEQIHFAITELTARRLTEKARLKAKSFLSIHPSDQSVREEIGAAIREWIREAATEALDVHTDFDEDTSMVFNLRLQQWWFEKIEKQLSELQAQDADRGSDHTNGPQTP